MSSKLKNNEKDPQQHQNQDPSKLGANLNHRAIYNNNKYNKLRIYLVSC